MKRKLLAIILTVVMLLPCFAIPTFADDPVPKDVDLRSIPGIDYDRITQKAEGGKKSYPVELNLGELTFNGQLKGDVGLDINELNDIINQTLREKNLSPSRVALISQLGKQVTRDAALQWGSQVIEGVLSFIPVDDLPIVEDIPGGFGIDDYFRYVVYGETKSMGDVIKDEYVGDIDSKIQKKIENVLEKAIAKSGKLTKATGGKVPLFGAVVNTIKTAVKWKEGNPRLDTYLEDLAKAQADVVDFYAACSRRANDLAESKGTNTWRIEFDKQKNYRTYTCNLWGVPNVMISAELSGVLTKTKGDDVNGEYEGTLWLDFNGVDMANSFDAQFRENCSHTYVRDVTDGWNKMISVTYEDIPNVTTSLERSMSGNVKASVHKGISEQKAIFSGSLSSEDDETTFNLDHTIKGISGTVGSSSWKEYETRITSSAIDSITLHYNRGVAYQVLPYVGLQSSSLFDTGSYTADEIYIGTVWKPLESEPTVFINFGTK